MYADRLWWPEIDRKWSKIGRNWSAIASEESSNSWPEIVRKWPEVDRKWLENNRKWRAFGHQIANFSNRFLITSRYLVNLLPLPIDFWYFPFEFSSLPVTFWFHPHLPSAGFLHSLSSLRLSHVPNEDLGITSLFPQSIFSQFRLISAYFLLIYVISVRIRLILSKLIVLPSEPMAPAAIEGFPDQVSLRSVPDIKRHIIAINQQDS